MPLWTTNKPSVCFAQEEVVWPTTQALFALREYLLLIAPLILPVLLSKSVNSALRLQDALFAHKAFLVLAIVLLI
jgi:hypothetical protein